MKLVSIIIPTFNQGEFIEETLKSILLQSYQNVEVIIQDALSTDSTQSICEKYAALDGRIKYFREKDCGQSDAINRGLAKASGTYFTWMCSDDTFCDSNALLKLVSALKKSEANVIGVFGRSNYVTEAGQYLRPYDTYEHDVTARVFKNRWPFAQPASLLRMTEARRVNGVNPSMHLCMDQDFFIRLTLRGAKFKFVPHMIANVRLQPNAKSVVQAHLSAQQSIKVNLRYFGLRALSPRSIYVGYTVSRFAPFSHKFLRFVYRRFIVNKTEN